MSTAGNTCFRYFPQQGSSPRGAISPGGAVSLIQSGMSVCHEDQAGKLMLDRLKCCVSYKLQYRNFPCVLAKQPEYGALSSEGKWIYQLIVADKDKECGH